MDNAAQLVAASYLLADLFGSYEDAGKWLRSLDAECDVAEAMPESLSEDNRALLLERLTTSGLLVRGRLDPFRLTHLQQVLQLIPLVQAMEGGRLAAPRPTLVWTLPQGVTISGRPRSYRRSLAILVSDALRSVQEDGRVVIASPFWSLEGCHELRPSLQRARTMDLPVTLAGAGSESRDGDVNYLAAMMAFARELRDEGFAVRALSYQPPEDGSLFHAKVVCGRTGYLGSGNLTMAGLERHVEIGVPLAEVDVAEVLSILEHLERTGLLNEELL